MTSAFKLATRTKKKKKVRNQKDCAMTLHQKFPGRWRFCCPFTDGKMRLREAGTYSKLHRQEGRGWDLNQRNPSCLWVCLSGGVSADIVFLVCDQGDGTGMACRDLEGLLGIE